MPTHPVGNRLTLGIKLSRGEDVLHAVDGRDLRAAAVGIGLDADADVQPAVTVEDVVASVAGDRIAAGAAEDDVAGLEVHLVRRQRGDLDRRQPQDLAQPLDAPDAGPVQPVVEENVLIGGHRRRRAAHVGLLAGEAGRRAVVADQRVVMVPARQGFRRVEAVAQDVRLLGREDRDAHVGIGAKGHILEDRPVKAEHALVAHDAFALDHDVVARLGVEIHFVVAGEQDVMALDGRVEEQLGIVAGRRIEATAALDPVVALVAEQEIHVVAAEDEIVAGAAEHFRQVDADEDRVLAGSAHEDVDAVRVGDDVVALVALDEVARIARIGDDVVAGAAVDEIDACAGFDAVVAPVAPDAVIAEIGDDACRRCWCRRRRYARHQ